MQAKELCEKTSSCRVYERTIRESKSASPKTPRPIKPAKNKRRRIFVLRERSTSISSGWSTIDTGLIPNFSVERRVTDTALRHNTQTRKQTVTDKLATGRRFAFHKMVPPSLIKARSRSISRCFGGRRCVRSVQLRRAAFLRLGSRSANERRSDTQSRPF